MAGRTLGTKNEQNDIRLNRAERWSKLRQGIRIDSLVYLREGSIRHVDGHK